MGFLHRFAHSVSGVLVVMEAFAEVVVSATARASRVERATIVNFMVAIMGKEAVESTKVNIRV